MNPIEKLASSYIYWPELEHHFQKNVSFGSNTLASFTDILSTVIKAKETNPDKEIIEFYALNQHLASERLKDGNILDEKLIETYQLYQSKVDALSQKMFAYLFTICIAESKHSYDLNDGEGIGVEQQLINWASQYATKHQIDPSEKQMQTQREKIARNYKSSQLSQYEKMCGSFYPQFVECFGFMNQVFKKYPSDYTNTMIKRMLPSFKESDLTIENILKTVSIIFQKDSFNKSYGGNSWHHIANHALNFATGLINAEVFVDQAFSLEHNEGSIFNKEIIFNSVDTFSTRTTFPKGTPTIGSGNTIAMSKTQLVLNMQHAGETLNFLALNNITNNQIDTIIESKKRVGDNLDKFDVSESLRGFFKNLKKEAENYSDSPVIKYLLSQNLQPTKINFVDFLSYTTEHGEKESILNEKKKAILELATQVSSEFSQPTFKTKSLKELVFEAFDVSRIPMDKQDKNILGGKAYGLSEMTKMGLPVPKAVVWTCENSLSFNAHPKEWSKALRSQMEGIKSYNTDKHGDVMVSIRSGAPASMPGMMDTILNVGIDDSNYQSFSDRLGKHTTDACAVRFMKLFTQSYFNLVPKWPNNINSAVKKFRKILEKNNISTSNGFFPLNKDQQIELSIHAVFKSVNSPRATAYREHNNMENLGTSAVMQHMVFGNLNHQSCTGVLFSRDCINGNKGLIGEFLVCAQGEDVVSGEVTPQNISEMKKWNLSAYQKLSDIAAQLEEKTGQVQDIEFTIENGEVYILQFRAAVSSTQANIKILQEKLNDKKISLQEFLIQVEPQALRLGKSVVTHDKVDFEGMCANPGIIQGICIKNEKDIAKYSEQAKKQKLSLILVAQETKPEHAPLMMKSDAFITQKGGFTSHAAILARSWNKPCLVGAINSLTSGSVVTLDASQGVWKGLKTVEDKRANPIVAEIVSAYPIEITHTASDKINNFIDWREFGQSRPATQKKFTKFLDMGHVAVMKMSLAAKKQSIKNK
jgi:pyruvate, orthophosphate dikinase